MTDNVEITFHHLVAIKACVIADECQNVYDGAEGWVNKDEFELFMKNLTESVNKADKLRDLRHKLRRCLKNRENLVLRYDIQCANGNYRKAHKLTWWENVFRDLAEHYRKEIERLDSKE